MQLQGKPGRPQIDSVSATKITLHWTEPENIGRTRITNYAICYGTKHMKLVDFKLHNVIRSQTSCTISEGIRAKEAYKFAVAAVSQEGRGPLSDFSEYVRTPTRDGKPNIIGCG